MNLIFNNTSNNTFLICSLSSSFLISSCQDIDHCISMTTLGLEPSYNHCRRSNVFNTKLLSCHSERRCQKTRLSHHLNLSTISYYNENHLLVLYFFSINPLLKLYFLNYGCFFKNPQIIKRSMINLSPVV